MEEIAWFYLSPGILDEKMTVYVAHDLKPGKQDLDVGEEVENRIMSWSDAMQLVLSGKIHDAKTMSALLLYDRIRGQA